MVVADEQKVTCEGRAVPALTVEGGELVKLHQAIRLGVDENNVTLFGLDNEEIAGQNHLPVTVAPPLPAALTGLRVETDHGAVIEAVNVTIMYNKVGELRLEAGRLPDKLHVSVTDRCLGDRWETLRRVPN